MAKGISINFLADVKDFLKGTKNVEDSLDDVSSSLDDVVKDGTKATDKLETGFRDLAKQAKASGSDIQHGIGGGVQGGVEEADIHLNSFKKSAKEAGKAAAGSMDGTMGGVLETLKVAGSELFANLGPGAAVAAATAGTALGLIGLKIAEDEAKAKAAEDRIRNMGLALIDAADAGIPLSVVADNLRKIVTNADDAPKKLKDIEEQSKKTGASVEGLAMAYAGNTEAVDLMAKHADEAYKRELKSLQDNAKEGEQPWSDKLEKLQTQAVELRGVQEETQKAADIEREWLNSGGAEIEAKNAAISSINSAYDDAAGSVQDFIDKETGVFDVQAYIDSMNARAQALLDYQDSVAKSGFTTEQKKALDAMGVEAASTLMGAYKNGTKDQQEQIKKILTESAKDSSGVSKALIDETFKAPVKATVEVGLDAVEARRQLSEITKKQSVQLVVDWRDKYGRPVY